MTVAELMTSDVATINPDASLREAIQVLRIRRIRHLPVVQDSKLVGILTDRDVKKAMPSLHSGVDRDEYEQVLDDTLVSSAMTRDPMTVSSTTSLKEALGLLVEKKFGALPVVDNGKLVGIVTDIDFLKAFYRTL